MEFLIDDAVSPDVAQFAAGHDAIHVRDRGMADAEHEHVMALVAVEEQIVSADSQFGAMLMLRKAQRPSVIPLRHGSPRRRPSERHRCWPMCLELPRT